MRKIAFGQKNKSLTDNLIEMIRYGVVVPHINNDDVILDLGCGYSAPFLSHLSSKIKNGTGLDISVSNNKVKNNIVLIRGSADKHLPFESNQFDTVTCLALIEHLNKPETMLKEVNRVLKKGGIFLLTTPSKKSKDLLEFLAYRLRIISKEEIEDHKRYYSTNTLKCNFIKAGFKEHNISIKLFEFGLNLFAKVIK